MSKPKFTPGPWIVDLEVSEDGPTVHDFKNGSQLVQTYLGPNVSIIEQRANAALIAAAPEMFEFIDALMRADLDTAHDLLINHGDDILAKARGES